MAEENESNLVRPHHNRRPLRENKNKVSALRQWLNILFCFSRSNNWNYHYFIVNGF